MKKDQSKKFSSKASIVRSTFWGDVTKSDNYRYNCGPAINRIQRKSARPSAYLSFVLAVCRSARIKHFDGCQSVIHEQDSSFMTRSSRNRSTCMTGGKTNIILLPRIRRYRTILLKMEIPWRTLSCRAKRSRLAWYVQCICHWSMFI